MLIAQANDQTMNPVVEVGHAAVSTHRVFPPFDFTYFASHLFWLCICFGLFYLFISRVVLPRMGTIVQLRQKQIDDDIGRAVQLKKEIDEAIARYEKEISDARLQADLKLRQAEDDIKGKVSRLRQEQDERLRVKLSDADASLAKRRDKALAEVAAIAAKTVPDIVLKLLGRSVSDNVVAETIDGLHDRGTR